MADMDRGFGRSPTFLVGSERQRFNLDQLQRREQHLAEQYQKNKPLCFSAGQYQQTHPLKAVGGHIDADVTLVSPMLVGVADGVSQIAEYGLDPSELPKELMKACEELAMSQLIPDKGATSEDSAYKGPIPLMRSAYEATEAMGSTTALLAIMDNSTMIHGKLHPMIAVLSIGDCEILVLRRNQHMRGLEVVFHTEMQRIDGNAQCPLQICRIDDRVDPDFDERMPIEVIERGSAVHCVSAYEGDIVVLGSDGVFDNLFLDEIVEICNQFFPAAGGSKFQPTHPALLEEVARRIVEACHAKTRPGMGGRYPEAPIGKGGKRDDTCCVVGEVMEWTEAQSEAWNRIKRQRRWQNLLTCGGGFAGFRSCCSVCTDDKDDDSCAGTAREYSYSEYAGSEGEYEDESRCVIA